MKLEHFQRDDFKDAVVGRCEDNRGGCTIRVGSQPVSRGDAPAIAGDEAWKAVLGHRRFQVVPDGGLVVEKFSGHDRADRVAAMVAFVGVARSITKEARERINSAISEFSTENV